MAEGKPSYRYVPNICRDYNTKTCSRPDCTRPHVCFKFFDPTSFCKRGKECEFSHNIFNPQSKSCLQKAGFNIGVKPVELKDAYVAALKEKEGAPKKKGGPGLLPSPQPQGIIEGFQTLAIGVPRICLNFNQGLCQNLQCNLLHICQAYIESTCVNNFKTCPFSHDIFRPDIKSRLSLSGLNVNQKPKQLIEDYRQALVQGAAVVMPQAVSQGKPRRGLGTQMKSYSVADMSSLKPATPRKKGRPKSQERQAPERGRHHSEAKASESDDSDSSVFDDYDSDQPKPAGKEKKTKLSRGKKSAAKGKQTAQGQQSAQGHSSKVTELNKDVPSVQKPAQVPKHHISPFEDAEICLYFLAGRCAYGESCKKHHQALPYVWQYKTLVKWISFNRDNIQLLEQSFCDVKTGSCPVIVEGQMFTVDFDSMMACSGDVTIPVQRLSTTSFVLETKDQSFATKWTWFWESDLGWVTCGQKNQQDDKKNVKKIQTQLEQAFQNDPASETSLKINGYPYKISFSDMKQKNCQSETERRLRRRPIFMSPAEVSNAARLLESSNQKVQGASGAMELPVDWTPMGEREVKTVKVAPKSTQFAAIRDIFKLSMPNATIILIKRVQNRSLWFTYNMKSEKLGREYGPANTNERRLFHGTTPTAVDPICEQNFDWRLYGSAVGARYGKGAYFAVNAEKADLYVEPDDDGLCFMFYARTLVGKTTKGDKKMRRPPAIDSENPNKLFDSCTDNPQSPSVFVLFDKEQYYPEFIICYKR